MAFTFSQALNQRKRVSVYSWLCLAMLLVVLPTGWVSAWAWERDLRWFYLFLISFFFSSLLVPISIYIAKRSGVLDFPSARRVHAVATPRLGGMAVYGAVILTLARNFTWSVPLAGLLSAGTLIYAMGVFDDVRGLSAYTRIIGQLIAVGIMILSGLYVTFIPHIPGWRVLSVLVTALWLVGITNAVNFLDGIDGLAAGMGTVCALLLVSVAWAAHQGILVYASAALAGACLGFIPYNWHPARVFLGDAGSTFIGFMLAGMALLGSWSNHRSVVGLASPLLILAIPIFDMTYTTISRIRNGSVRTFRQWLEYTGKDHFHHRLMHLGMNVQEAVGFIIMVNLCLGLGALVTHFSQSILIQILLLSQSFIIFMIIVVLMLLGRQVTPDKKPRYFSK